MLGQRGGEQAAPHVLQRAVDTPLLFERVVDAADDVCGEQHVAQQRRHDARVPEAVDLPRHARHSGQAKVAREPLVAQRHLIDTAGPAGDALVVLDPAAAHKHNLPSADESVEALAVPHGCILEPSLQEANLAPV